MAEKRHARRLARERKARQQAGAAAPSRPASPTTPPAAEPAAFDRKDIPAVERRLAARNPGYEPAMAWEPVWRGFSVGLANQPIADISPLAGCPLTRLDLGGCRVADLTPLNGMTLLEELYLESCPVTDLSPLAGLSSLRELYLSQTPASDLAPLAGLPLEQLNLLGAPVSDLSPLAAAPIVSIWVNATRVSDISPVVSPRLESLSAGGAEVADLAPLAAATGLRRLDVSQTPVTDLTPLAELRLHRLIFSPHRINAGLDAVRNSPSLRELGLAFESLMPAQRFWRAWDAGELQPPPEPSP